MLSIQEKELWIFHTKTTIWTKYYEYIIEISPENHLKPNVIMIDGVEVREANWNLFCKIIETVQRGRVIRKKQILHNWKLTLFWNGEGVLIFI